MKNTRNLGYIAGFDLIWETKHPLYQVTLWCQRYHTPNNGIPIFYRKYQAYTTEFDYLKLKWFSTNRNRSMFTHMKKDVIGLHFKPGVAKVNGNMEGSP